MKKTFTYLKQNGKYLLKPRVGLPQVYYNINALIGDGYKGTVLRVKDYEELIKLTRKYCVLSFGEEETGNYAEIVFDVLDFKRRNPEASNFNFHLIKIRYHEDGTYFVDERRGKTFYVPYYITMGNKYSPENYFITYLPHYKKFEIVSNDIEGEDDIIKHIDLTKVVEDKNLIAKIENDYKELFGFLKYQINILEEELDKKDAKKREKLFRTTNVLRNAKAFYSLLKIPQNIQDKIYKKIKSETDVLNMALLDFDFMTWEDGGWEDKDDLAYVKNICARYDLVDVWKKYHEASAKFIDDFAYMAGLGRLVLAYQKTLSCLISPSGVRRYVFIDSKDRAKMSEVSAELIKTGELEELIFFDEVQQAYPMPRTDLFEQIDYRLKAQANRKLENVRDDLIRLNTDLLGDEVASTIDAVLPIFDDIKIEVKLRPLSKEKNKTFTLKYPKEGLTYVSLCFLLEQEIGKLFGFNDIFNILELEFSSKKQNFSLMLFSEKMDNARIKNVLKEITSLCTGAASTLLMGYFETGRLEKLRDNYDRLHDFISYQHEENAEFFIHLDWKSPIEELDDALSTIFKFYQPKIKAKLPTAKDFDEDDGVGSEGIFITYDKALREHGLQFGFYDTDCDEYLLVVHKIEDAKKMKELFLEIGGDYFEASDVD